MVKIKGSDFGGNDHAANRALVTQMRQSGHHKEADQLEKRLNQQEAALEYNNGSDTAFDYNALSNEELLARLAELDY